MGELLRARHPVRDDRRPGCQRDQSMSNEQYFSIQINCRIQEVDKNGNYMGGNGQLELSQSIRLHPGMSPSEVFRVLEKVYAFGKDLKECQQ
jgi:hypothetical protein